MSILDLPAVRSPRPAILLTAFLAVLANGCGGAGASPLARATVDTLPSGIVRVMSDAATGWRDTLGWRLVEVSRTSGEEGAPSEVINPQAIAMDETGRVYLSDQKPAVIKVYEPDGRFIRSIGREGQGPGEFQVAFVAVRHGLLAVHDPRTARTSLFDTAGTFLRSWRSSCCWWSDIAVDRAGRVYIPTNIAREDGEESRGSPYTRYDSTGAPLDTLFVPRGPEGKSWTVRSGSGSGTRFMMGTSVPYTPSVGSAYDPAGGFVHGLSSGYQLVVSSRGSDTSRLFGRAWTPDPITDAQKRAKIEQMIGNWTRGGAFGGGTFEEKAFREAFKIEDIPTTLPAFGGLKVDEDGNRWIWLHNLADSSRSHFDVFDPEGAWLGRVVAPVAFPEYGRQAWGRSEVVVAIEDEDGRPVIVRYRIEKARPR